MLLVAACLAAVSAAAPRIEVESEVFHYLFVFDITQSMNVADYEDDALPRSRLETASRGVIHWLANAPCGSRAAIALFSGHRTFLLLAPAEVCGHYAEFKALLEGIDWRMAWRARSEITKGLDSAMLLTSALGPEIRLVFLSDGHEAPPLNPKFPPRTKAKRGTVDGLIIGVGGSTPRPIPKFDRENRPLGFWHASEVLQVDTYSLGRGSDVVDEAMAGVDAGNLEQRIAEGTEHLSALRAEYLANLARRTGLGYSRLTDSEGLSDRLSSAEFAEPKRRPVSVSWMPAAVSLLLLLTLYSWPTLVDFFARSRSRS